jgi:DNA-binding NarL/FixJ family response regulator
VPALADVFAELGLDLCGVSSDVDMHRMLDLQPDAVFVDTDYVKEDQLRTINLLRMLVPGAAICVYTSQRSPDWAKACHIAGATAVFSKNAKRGEIVFGMRSALRRQIYTDARLRD